MPDGRVVAVACPVPLTIRFSYRTGWQHALVIMAGIWVGGAEDFGGGFLLRMMEGSSKMGGRDISLGQANVHELSMSVYISGCLELQALERSRVVCQ